MYIRFLAIAIMVAVSITNASATEDMNAMPTVTAFRLEADAGNAHREGAISSCNMDGWIGSDTEKLRLKSEGTRLDGRMEDAEFWALYSRTISTFWDAQLGIRQDTSPHPASYLTVGVEGLAPYFFATEAHLFISNKGYASLRLRTENDLRITQQLITKPYAQLDASFANDAQQQLGAGISKTQLGLQTRYEITRKFAPYIDLRYERSYGNTIAIIQRDGQTRDDMIASVGLRVMF